MSDYPHDVALLRKHVKELVGLDDATVEALYSTWSDIGFSASWLYVDESNARAFERWLYAAQSIDVFVSENERLRALIKSAEALGVADACPWCRGQAHWDPGGKHEDDCPAFTPAGKVRVVPL